MAHTDGAFSPHRGSHQLKAQIDKLAHLDHHVPVSPNFDTFDAETESLLSRLYGEAHLYLEAYKYASLGEAEALVNLPESAQEPLTQDRAKTAIQQRRQALLGIVNDLEELESREARMLTGEDREDPPGFS